MQDSETYGDSVVENTNPGECAPPQDVANPEPATIERLAGDTDGQDATVETSNSSDDGGLTRPMRPMQPVRFVIGLLLSATGIGIMLTVAVGTLHDFGLNGRLSLPTVGLCMIIGLMLLGGGFGIMATAAPKFDDDEFERLMHAGEKRRIDENQDWTVQRPPNQFVTSRKQQTSHTAEQSLV